MRPEKKVDIQQKIIAGLQEEKQQLIRENRELYGQLEFEKTKPKTSYEQTKRLESELKKCIEEYKCIAKTLKEAREKYHKKLKELNTLKSKYSRDMSKIIKSIKKEV